MTKCSILNQTSLPEKEPSIFQNKHVFSHRSTPKSLETQVLEEIDQQGWNNMQLSSMSVDGHAL